MSRRPAWAAGAWARRPAGSSRCCHTHLIRAAVAAVWQGGESRSRGCRAEDNYRDGEPNAVRIDQCVGQKNEAEHRISYSSCNYDHLSHLFFSRQLPVICLGLFRLSRFPFHDHQVFPLAALAALVSLAARGGAYPLRRTFQREQSNYAPREAESRPIHRRASLDHHLT